MEKFECKKCHKIFEAEGKKIERNNAIYGKTWKWEAQCSCGELCDQYIAPKAKKKVTKRSNCSKNCASCPYRG